MWRVGAQNQSRKLTPLPRGNDDSECKRTSQAINHRLMSVHGAVRAVCRCVARAGPAGRHKRANRRSLVWGSCASMRVTHATAHSHMQQTKPTDDRTSSCTMAHASAGAAGPRNREQSGLFGCGKRPNGRVGEPGACEPAPSNTRKHRCTITQYTYQHDRVPRATGSSTAACNRTPEPVRRATRQTA